MNKTIIPSKISGQLSAPPSKSVSHRAVICAALAEGHSVVSNVLLSEDILATCDAMRALGAKIEMRPEGKTNCYTLEIDGTDNPSAVHQTIDCRESGSTLRFVIPIAALDAEKTIFRGHGRLADRPLDPYHEELTQKGMTWQAPDSSKTLPLTLSGKLSAGTFSLPGNISSQFITGLLFALPLLSQDSVIKVTTAMESAPYVAITLAVLRAFGIQITVSEDFRYYTILGGQTYQANHYHVEGDYSQAAFWLAMGVLGKSVTVTGLAEETTQGDAAIVDFIRQMGGKLISIDGGYRAEPSTLHGITMDVSQCPDLVPVLAVLAAGATGESAITHAERLRLKESDRLSAMAEVLTVLGVSVKQQPDGLIITGTSTFSGGTIDAHNDHRIAMAAAVAAVRAENPVTIIGADAVKKSYPDFWEDYQKLGGKLS